MTTKYPNLELLEYKARQMLANDKEFLEKMNQRKAENKYLYPEFNAIVFTQMWGSTNTGFDVTEDGRPAIGGCAMTKEYTTVMNETLTGTYIVFFGDKPCYKVEDANDRFYSDLSERNMASLSEAKKLY